jgi:hypothetical protein
MVMKWAETSKIEKNPCISGPCQKACLDLNNSGISGNISSGRETSVTKGL